MKKEHRLFSAKPAQWDNILFIDPGVRNGGFAFWEKLERMERPRKKKLLLPDKSGTFHAPTNVNWLVAVHDFQANWLGGFIIHHDVKTVVIESAEVWATDEVSMASATKGDIFKLSYLIGTLGHVFARHVGKKPTLISPRDWKGTMPKDVMKRRLRIACAEAAEHRQFSEHEADAVAMGVSVQKLL